MVHSVLAKWKLPFGGSSKKRASMSLVVWSYTFRHVALDIVVLIEVASFEVADPRKL